MSRTRFKTVMVSRHGLYSQTAIIWQRGFETRSSLLRGLSPVILLAMSICVGGCDRSRSRTATDQRERVPAPNPVSVSADPSADIEAAGSNDLLVEVTAEVGLPAEEVNWPDGLYLTPEITPGGVALFDYDDDGDLDIYQICHCQPLPMPAAFREPAPNRLLRRWR